VRNQLVAALVLLSTLLFTQESAATDDTPESADRGCAKAMQQPTVELKILLGQVAERSKKRFLVAQGVPAGLVTGPIEENSITYPLLLTILWNNGLAAVAANGAVSIIPVATIRQYPVPTISSDDPGIPDDEWVSELVRLQFSSAAQLVPILRPLLPQYGHLAAYSEQNALLVVDRYGNVKRIIALARSLDKPSSNAPPRQP
jgi:general secretion pathway protein D